MPQYEQNILIGSEHDEENNGSEVSENESEVSGSSSDSNSDVNDGVEVFTEIEASLTEEYPIVNRPFRLMH